MSEEQREASLEELRKGFYAASSAPSVAAKWKTINKALGLFNLTPLPPSPQKVLALGAALKAGGYRSAESYLQAYRTRADREECPFGASEVRALKDAARSCRRGLGGPVRAMALPFERLGEECVPDAESPWCVGGPLGPKNAVILGSWFLMREAELAGARACNMKVITQGSAPPLVSWALPASKSDQQALGVSRTHGCCCSGAFRRRCPVHAAWDQLLILEEKFPDCFEPRGSRTEAEPPVCRDDSLPLFPSAAGGICTKEAITETIIQAAKFLKVPTEKPDQSERVSGHSLRATGAQGLARAGLELWSIQLIGRWGSDAVKTYVRDAFIESSSSWARRAVEKTDLEQLIKNQVVVFPSAPSQKEHNQLVEALRPAFFHEVAAGNSFEDPDKVVVSSTGIAHQVLFGPPEVELDNAATVCGWTFGGAKARLGGPDLLPREHKFLCSKCFPERRKHLKSELERRARLQIGEA